MTQDDFELTIRINYSFRDFREMTILRELNDLMVIKKDTNIDFFKEVIKICSHYVSELEVKENHGIDESHFHDENIF